MSFYVLPMARPVIGICAAIERASWGVWNVEALLVPRSYARAVERAGGVSLVLVPEQASTEEPDLVLDLVDGLILAGGSDMDPATYGAEPHPETGAPARDRDDFEIALAARAIERDIPLLGICRGMQVMNVARGGTLQQHLPETVGHGDHRRVAGSFDGADHDVRLQEGSLAERAAGEPLHGTLSHHHQGVERIGTGLAVTGWSVLDDLPEAIEVPDRRYALGVQWHPEADERSRLVASLVAEAAAARAASSEA
jgi:putative glutamine amidotransferase